MGLADRRRATLDAKEERRARDENSPQWEYLARNLDRVAGIALEDDFNKHGRKGWELVAVAKDYAVFKRPLGG